MGKQDDEPGDEPGGGDGPSGGTLTEDRVVEIVRNVVGDLLDSHRGDDPDDGKAGEDDPDGKKGVGKPRSAAAVEDDFEARTRKVIEQIKGEERHAADHAKLNEGGEKPEPEKPPVKQRRIERALWGASQ